MQIQFERTGGIAGMRMAITINSESLSPEEARQLRELVDAADFFRLRAEITGPTKGTDRFLYTLSIEVKGQRHTVRTSDAEIPAELRPLIDWLTNAVRKTRRSSTSP